LYSQFPGIEIFEVPDYTLSVIYNPEVNAIFATEFDLKEKDFFPIKTYIDFELEENPKEEFKVDPLATVLEFMSSIKPSQQIWIQIIFTSSYRLGRLNRKNSEWQSMVENEVQKIRLESAVFPEELPEQISEERLKAARPRATWKQTQQVEAMERNLGKHPFDVGARGIYITSSTIFFIATSPCVAIAITLPSLDLIS